MARKLKCECGTCHVCKCRERARMKARIARDRLGFASEGVKPAVKPARTMKKLEDVPGIDEALGIMDDDNGHEAAGLGPATAREKKILRKVVTVKNVGLKRILFMNRVGVPVTAEVHRDGGNIVICARLGDTRGPEEPVVYFDINRLPWRHKMNKMPELFA